MSTNSNTGVNLKGLEQIFRICGREDGMAALKNRIADYYLEHDKRVAMFLKEMEQYDKPKFVGDPASNNNKERACMPKRPKKASRPRELMTFRKARNVTEGHLTLLYSKLVEEEWIDGLEVDFKALFSGELDEDCWLTWMGKFGKGTLVDLFRQLSNEGLIIVPPGYSLAYILEGHFRSQQGQVLTGLDKGDKPNVKAIPVMLACINLLKASVDQLLHRDYDDEDEDFKSVYSRFDNDGMHEEYH